MNSDIRVLTSLKGHPKIFKLKTLIGKEAVEKLLWIWITASQSKPDGILTGWDASDIAAAAMWEGNPIPFVAALITCGWLEETDGVYSLHDWQEHQVWACGAKARSENARKAAQAKWAKRNGNKTK